MAQNGKLWRLSGAVLLIVLPAATSLDLFAQSAQSLRYPWDDGEINCTNPPDRNRAACDARNWGTFEQVTERIQFLYGNENFVLLERAMSELASSQLRYPSGDTRAAAVYWAFRHALSVPVLYSFQKERIARWRAAVPRSHFATFAEARLAYVNAWTARGQRSGAGVSKESWELFGQRLDEAEGILLKAPPQVKETPIWHNLLLAISQDRPNGQNQADKVFEQGVTRWPGYLELYEVRLTRLTPNWGGSWLGIDAFIDRANDRLQATEGRSMYARLYINLADQGYAPGQTAMDWSKMKRSLDDLVARYPDELRFGNLRASFACSARDKEAFGAALRAMNQSAIRPNEWLQSHSYDACMRWAGT